MRTNIQVKDVAFGKGSIVVELSNHRIISMPLGRFPRLQNAKLEELHHWEFAAAGHGIHWPKLDEDIGIDRLLSGWTPKDSEPSEATLLAFFNNHSENIEYTKNRSYALLAGYSAVCAFLIDKLDKLELSNYKAQIIFLTFFAIQSILCCIIILTNYYRIKKRREDLLELHKKLQSSDDPRKNDWWIPLTQIFYLAAISVLTYNKVLSHITL